MVTNSLSSDSFSECIQRANRIASQILRVHLGGYTNEDIVGVFIEKQLKSGKGQAEIEKTIRGPQIYRCLENVKNDLYESETAAKRGKGLTSSLDQVERYCGSNRDNPELALIQKEEASLLAQLINDAHLSETQTAILALDSKGYSSIEIARELGIDVDTVYARRSDAQRKLAKLARHLANRDSKESK
ncbi:MAG: hypothetical protein HY863_09745 [Chloroflexi bacterium]|nr:hypothetical protein [Chloroflexota bacterium]